MGVFAFVGPVIASAASSLLSKSKGSGEHHEVGQQQGLKSTQASGAASRNQQLGNAINPSAAATPGTVKMEIPADKAGIVAKVIDTNG